jgi:serine/threonine-protein kinase HipA
MKRREALYARDQNRPVRTLYAWDFLVGVQDFTRQGALRFRKSGTQAFLDNDALAALPVTHLGELVSVAWQLTHKRIDDLDALRRWLAVLVAPGASLGGARPKANFMEVDGSLWIGKFPAREDDRDVGAWEFATHQMAQRAGIDVPAAKLLRLGEDFHTFCVERFDRLKGQRRFYASAMTLLRKDQSEGCSYLELAQFMRGRGDAGQVSADLAQLFRRVVFNVAVGNRDDHLAPAFDVNPNTDKAEHVLNIDDRDNRPDLQTVLATAAFYGLSANAARQIVDEVAAAVDGWREVARSVHISRADVELTAAAFSAHTAWREGGGSRL